MHHGGFEVCDALTKLQSRRSAYTGNGLTAYNLAELFKI